VKKQLYVPSGGAMRIAFFSSGGPGNFAAALELATAHRSKLEIACLVVDRDETPSEALARRRGIEVVKVDFIGELRGLQGVERRERAIGLFAEVLDGIGQVERKSRRVDVCALAFRQILAGNILERFEERILNQHPADLGVFDIDSRRRRYVGIKGLERSITDGAGWTRTSTILINEGVDTGEILVQGPEVPVSEGSSPEQIQRHEERQKRLSDWPSVKTALALLSEGRIALSRKRRWHDGCRTVYIDGREMPYCGLQLS
jgi:folate-dependent phosphoribosylglycinamide formyltransferase PurN